MKDIKYLFLVFVLFSVLSCSKESSEPSTVTRLQSFGFLIADKITVDEGKVVKIPFAFDDNQIIGFDVDIHVDGNSTASEDIDFHTEHGLSVLALAKKGEFVFEALEDLFLEGDEKVFLTLSSSSVTGLPKSKTIEITVKNVGGCPSYEHAQFVGTYEVVSDAWEDWKVGTTLTIANEGVNTLSFKYNCGTTALPILMKIDPATFGISGVKQEYCSYNLPPVTKFFGDIVEASSKVNTCEKSITVTIAHTDSNGANYGSGALVLKKK
ncbi:MAG: hypothetical protein IPO26_18035 [Saprospiraceae bacterium]|jgi:hypothetical protein|nr:hypothetical protein [Saprospiraceae bacterium]